MKRLKEMTINMAIASHTATDPRKQVVQMAKRYQRRTISPKTKKALQLVIDCPDPVKLVRRVQDEHTV